ncbi:Os04g0257201 [Oryza sativa Japonica Group]|uniref:Os04g0257201 protein n=1 Tax=Oryza sativa subsp. japonica TaxID=39947 RepID=A0A0P0W898_ORYSJ|nr:Os04g0257201 [Oryza sativa Japonica Group]
MGRPELPASGARCVWPILEESCTVRAVGQTRPPPLKHGGVGVHTPELQHPELSQDDDKGDKWVNPTSLPLDHPGVIDRVHPPPAR